MCIPYLHHLAGALKRGFTITMESQIIRCKKKMFGIFPHHALDPYHPLMRGLDDISMCPTPGIRRFAALISHS